MNIYYICQPKLRTKFTLTENKNLPVHTQMFCYGQRDCPIYATKYMKARYLSFTRETVNLIIKGRQ